MRATKNSMDSARRLRKAMSPPEVRLWNRLRRSPLGMKFRRQHPIGPYVTDFYCPAAKLVIEVDGLVHDFASSAARDDRRDAYIKELGLKVLRIPAAEIFADVDAVAQSIISICADLAGPSTTQLR